MSTIENQSEALDMDKIRKEVRARRANLIKRGKFVTGERFCEMLEIELTDLAEGVKTLRFIELEFEGKNYYPSLYAEAKTIRSEIEQIAVTLGPLSAMEKWLFFTRPKYSMSMTPLKALAQGRFEEVRMLALAVREM